MLAHAWGQRGFPYKPREEIEAARDARLRKIVRYAAETVPFYRDLFSDLDVDPREIGSADDLDRLPLVDKETVRTQGLRFRSESRLGRDSIRFLTNGTSASPLAIHHDRNSLLANIAFGERQRAVITNALGRRTGYRLAMIGRRTSIERQVRAVNRDRTWIPFGPKRLSLAVEEPVASIIAALNDFRPDVLGGYGSYLETLFRVVQARGLTMHMPRIVSYHGDAMSDPGRALIERRFGVPVLSNYGAVEAFRIAFACGEGEGFHLHEDLCRIRLLDTAGKGVASGTPGELVISNLVNRGTVLLNYRLGDVGVTSTVSCPCGRALHRLVKLRGRVGEVLVLGERLVHPAAVWEVLEDWPGLVRYQLVQEEPQRFTLFVLTGDRADYDNAVARMLTGLRELLGPVTIEPAYSPGLLEQQSGKFSPVLSRCADQTIA